MTTTHTVLVSNLSPTTTVKQLREFFTFCGSISSIDHNTNTQTATIHFDRPSAAKTALMLNGGTLDGSTLQVVSEKDHEDDHDDATPGTPEQSDKPRAGIAAEYLAKGYQLGDHILQRAIEIDTKQGISKRFIEYIKSLDQSLGAKALGPDQTISAKVQEKVQSATQQAKAVDEQKGISKTAGDYYSKALSSSFGQKVFQFYTSTSKQVLDIHEEARRIAEEHKAATPAPAPPVEKETPA